MLVSVAEIIQKREDWCQRHAEVSGTFTYKFENVSIQDEDSGKTLWVSFNPKGTEIIGFELKEGVSTSVVIEGYVSTGRSGHFGMFDGEISHVTRITSAKRYFQAERSAPPNHRERL